MPAASKKAAKFAIGVDYGTNSVRAVVVDCRDGSEIAQAVFNYPTGERGVILDATDPHFARQHPGDYINGFVRCVRQAVRNAAGTKSFRPECVVGIGVDTTGSTPLPVNADGVPLALTERFCDDPNAQAWLWKDHTSYAEAAEITALARKRGEPYLAKCGGTYSSEWFWSKILHCRRVAPQVFKAAASWVEFADFVPAYITGNTAPAQTVRGVCAAGHKAMYSPTWGGLPSADFLAALHPDLGALRSRLYDRAVPSSERAGCLTPEFARKTGLPTGTPVAAGAFDAHHGAVGAGVKPGTMVKIIGTSTCDITVWPSDRPLQDIPGVCGIVDGSVLPGMYGIEAGQSAVGDIFNWVASLGTGKPQHNRLTAEAQALCAGQSGLLTLDWHNGNRTVLVNPRLTGLTVGQTLHTSLAELYRAAIEATAFGSRVIIERHEEFGVAVTNVTHCGGIGEKNDLVNQVYADVLGRPIRISRSAQTCALGAAIFGAVVGGAYKSAEAAQKAMVGFKPTVFKPRKSEQRVYDELFKLYRVLHDAFGGVQPDGSPATLEAIGRVMPDLLALRDRVAKRRPS